MTFGSIYWHNPVIKSLHVPCHLAWKVSISPHSVRTQENTDQKNFGNTALLGKLYQRYLISLWVLNSCLKIIRKFLGKYPKKVLYWLELQASNLPFYSPALQKWALPRIYYWKSSEIQKQPPEVFCERWCFRNFTNFTGKHLCSNLFLIKLQAVRKENSNTGVFLWNLQKF